MNLFYYSTLGGLLGAVLINGLTYFFRLLGVQTSTPWEIAANVFLNPRYIHTLSGALIGLIGTVALSIGTALLIAFVLKWTGFNLAWLKGIICANAFGFISMGLFMNLLHIWPQIRNEPGTNLVAFLNLSLLGIVQAILLKKWQRNLA
ncbi:MAG TPA: hypothetical protein VHY08_16415 [Bacillota bacterium]|nr:hypothetical protein [Bacillota bacterium]